MAENLNTERGANAVIISRQAGIALAFSQEWHIKLTLLETGPDETKWLIKALIKTCPND